LNKQVEFLILLLLGYLIGTGVPFYFASGWIVGLVVYTLIAVLSVKNKFIIKQLKWFIILLSILIISFMALYRAILPVGQTLNNQYYALLDSKKEKEAEEVKQKFSKVHMISSTLNITNIIIEFFLFYTFFNYIYGRKEEGPLE